MDYAGNEVAFHSVVMMMRDIFFVIALLQQRLAPKTMKLSYSDSTDTYFSSAISSSRSWTRLFKSSISLFFS